MFAIEINDESIAKIVATSDLPSDVYLSLAMFNHNRNKWYLIRGYINLRGAYEPWAFLPSYILSSRYEFDPVKIQTDWDQIVRKDD